MYRLKHILISVFSFSLVVLLCYLFYVQKFELKDTAIHIVQSFKFDMKDDKPKDGNKDMKVDPHGNEGPELKKPEEVKPEVQIKATDSKQLNQTVLKTEDKKPTKEVAVKPDVKSTEVSQVEVKKVIPKPEKPSEKSKSSSEKLCSKRGDNLVGSLLINQTIANMEELVKEFSTTGKGEVEKGGRWKPKTCKARVKSAIIIPFRKREEQLKLFLRHLHPILQRQQLDYRIFVIEQADNDPFNRAGLFNVGFKEALKYDAFDCFVFSDVDLFPEDDRNYYGCPTSPRHMSVAIDKFDYRLPYEGIFGGVGAFKKKDFETINGFSNLFWGWGGEDDDLYARTQAKGLRLTRPSMGIGRYSMILVHHFQSHQANPNRMNLLQNSAFRMTSDGLSSLKYKLNKAIELPLVTVVNIKLSPSMYGEDE